MNMKSYDAKELQLVLEYWTPERKAKAKPVLPPNVTTEEYKLFANKGEISYIENIIIPQSNSHISSSIISEPYEVDVNERPYFCGGKLFFTKGEGDDAEDHFCSAQFVGHCQMLLTAAHCVRDHATGDYYNKFLFSRGYRETDEGTDGQDFVIEQVATPEEWVSEIKNSAFDYAFCRTTDSYSEWMGIQIGIPYTDIHAIGYPSNYGDKKVMYGVDGTKGEIKNDKVQMKNNPMREGNSGGAWIANLSNQTGGLKNLVVGINSFHKDDESDNEYSPLFNQRTINLFNEVLDVTGENPRRCD